MFGWGKKKLDAGEEAALKAGEDFGRRFTEAALGYKKKRFDPVYDRYLDVFRGQLRDAINSEKVPPILSARWSVETFEENILKLQKEMFAEMQTALSDWFAAFDQMNFRSETEQALRDMIAKFCTDLYEDGKKIVESYAIVIGDADNTWRKAHPLEALRFLKEQ